MISGIGTDIVEIGRIRDSYNRFGRRFLDKIFTNGELEYCLKKKDPVPSLAVRFAVKEAFVKAAHLGRYHTNSWTDVSVVMSPSGIPGVEVFNSLGSLVAGQRILVSVSHSDHYAMATVVIERL